MINNGERKKKYEAPAFIKNESARKKYPQWLMGRARAHVKRDKRRGYKNITTALYQAVIHKAVSSSRGQDAYTGEMLRWDLIGTFNNEEARRGREESMRRYALQPSVDHEHPASKKANFKICAWRTNDAKGYLSIKEFRALCKRILKHD